MAEEGGVWQLARPISSSRSRRGHSREFNLGPVSNSVTVNVSSLLSASLSEILQVELMLKIFLEAVMGKGQACPDLREMAGEGKSRNEVDVNGLPASPGHRLLSTQKCHLHILAANQLKGPSVYY